MRGFTRPSPVLPGNRGALVLPTRSADAGVHFLQIWVLPNQRALKPSYQQKFFGQERADVLRLVVSPDGADASLTVNQDVRLYASMLSAGTPVRHTIAPARKVYVQVISGILEVAGETLTEGAGLELVNESELSLLAGADAHFLLFDLAA